MRTDRSPVRAAYAERIARVTGQRWLRWLAATAAFLAGLEYFWTARPGILLQGAVIGGLTALIAFGIALVWRANRIVNFAQGDLGAAPAALAVLLIVGPQWPLPIAVVVGLGAAIGIGVLVEVLVIRRLANAPRLILTVATIGLAQIFVGLGLALPYFFNLTVPPQSYPLPIDISFRVDPILFSGHDVLAMLMVPVAIGALTWLLRYTDLGIAIRASAENASRASLVGVNVSRIRIAVWVIATVLAFVAMMLRAGVVGLPIGSVLGPGILLRALAAAVIGRMENLPAIFAAAVALGIIESAVLFDRGDTALIAPILFVVILGALAFQHRDRLSRYAETSSWQSASVVRPIPRELAVLPEVRWGRRVVAVALLAAALAVPSVLGEADLHKASAIAIFSIVAISLVILTGWAGQVSLGQFAFMGVGAAVAGWLTSVWGWDLSLGLLAAAVVGGGVSLLVGLPALRVRGLLLAVTTLAFALAVQSYLLNRDFVTWLPAGRVAREPLFGRVFLDSEARYYYLCLAVLIIALGMASSLRRGRTGRVLVATHHNERAIQAAGISVVRAKLTAFAMAGAFASVAGGLFVHHQQAFTGSTYSADESLKAFAMVVIGGLGSLPGALLGTAYVQGIGWLQPWFPAGLRAFVGLLGTGVGLLIVLMVLPGGLGSLLVRARDVILRVVAARRGLVVPSLIADVRDGDSTARRDDTMGTEVTDNAEWAGTNSGGPGWAGPSSGDFEPIPPSGVAADAAPVLAVKDLCASYGKVQVLFGAGLEVYPGEIIALLGTNGAGKSTVLNSISGVLSPQRGAVLLAGEDIARRAPHEVCRLGITQAPGGRGVFPSLTVAENLRMAGWLQRRDGEAVRVATEAALDVFDELRPRLGDPAGNLSGGQQQMLTIAMALIASPKVLMIDELSLGLAPTIVERLLEVVEQIRAAGVAIILVEQSVNVALTVASRAYFMEKGEVRFDGPTADLLDRPDVLRSVFLEGAASSPRGTVVAVPARRDDPIDDSATPALEIRGLSRAFGGVQAVSDVTMTVAPGEVVGVIGPNGAGKTTLFDLVSGFVSADAGRVLVHGADVTSFGPDRRARAGLGRSFQEAGLFAGLTVFEAIAVSLDDEVEVRDPLAIALNVSAAARSEAAVRARVDELIEQFGLGAFRDKFIAELSTGSRRVVDLACILGQRPSVVLFDEPSSGIAQRETEALGPLLLRIRDVANASLVVIEHDMPLIASVSDRLIALDLGRVVTDGTPDEVVCHPAVVESYLGGRPEIVARSGERKAVRA